MLSFRTLTWVPLDRRLIRAAMLTGPERDWVDAYHAGVQERIAARVEPATAAWLRGACAPL